MSKLWLAILPFLLLFVASFHPAFASNKALVAREDLKSLGFGEYESINPDSLIYPLKRMGEKVKSLIFSGQENKSKYAFELLNVRFNELVYIANYQKSGFITEVVNRYNTSIGQLKAANYQVNNKPQLLNFLKILETMRDRHPANSASWLILQQAVDTTRSIL